MKQNNKCGRYILHVTISTSPSVASIAESSFFKLVYRTLSSSGSAADAIVGDLEIVGLVKGGVGRVGEICLMWRAGDL